MSSITPDERSEEEVDSNALFAYEVGKHQLQFECEWAVYPKGSGSSICYLTSEERAKFVATAIDRFMQTDEGRNYFKANAKAEPPRTNE